MCIMESFNGFSQFHLCLYYETTYVKLEESSLINGCFVQNVVFTMHTGCVSKDRLHWCTCVGEGVEVGVSVFQLYFYIEVCSIL